MPTKVRLVKAMVLPVVSLLTISMNIAMSWAPDMIITRQVITLSLASGMPRTKPSTFQFSTRLGLHVSQVNLGIASFRSNWMVQGAVEFGISTGDVRVGL